MKVSDRFCSQKILGKRKRKTKMITRDEPSFRVDLFYGGKVVDHWHFENGDLKGDFDEKPLEFLRYWIARSAEHVLERKKR